jgi:hypothetical protein
MKTLVLGLLKALGTWFLACAVVAAYLVLRHGMTVAGSIGIVLSCGFLLAIAIGLLIAAGRSFLEHAAVAGGGTAYPKDAAKVALIGQMQSLHGRSLTAPLDGTDCLMYRYTVRRIAGQGEQRSAAILAHGVGLVPSQIETATGAWKLLAVPALVGHGLSNDTVSQAKHFASYARRTRFTPIGKQASDALLAEWRDNDGDYRSDVSFEDVSNIDSRSLQAEQHTVAPGDAVCVIGRFSSQRGGIVPAPEPARLFIGDSTHFAAKLKREVITRTLIAALLLALLVGGAILSEHRPTTSATRVSQADHGLHSNTGAV